VAIGQNTNEFNLVQRPKANAETLEKMRKKLAGGSESTILPRPKSRRKRRGTKSFLWVLLAVAVLAGLNVFARTHKDAILELVGMETLTTPLAPPAGLERDDLARFWALAAFDEVKLRSRFAVPKTAIVDPVDARHHLDDILSRAPLGDAARAEVASLRSAVEPVAGANLTGARMVK
jgi:hypothetical protein